MSSEEGRLNIFTDTETSAKRPCSLRGTLGIAAAFEGEHQVMVQVATHLPTYTYLTANLSTYLPRVSRAQEGEATRRRVQVEGGRQRARPAGGDPLGTQGPGKQGDWLGRAAGGSGFHPSPDVTCHFSLFVSNGSVINVFALRPSTSLPPTWYRHTYLGT